MNVGDESIQMCGRYVDGLNVVINLIALNNLWETQYWIVGYLWMTN